VEAVRTLPPAAAVTLEVLDAGTVAQAVAVATAEAVLDAAFCLGKGEDATRARREREKMVAEKRMFAVCLSSKCGKINTI
jgi:hypothetical protein